MATKQDFTEPEWTALHKGVTGSGLLVSSAIACFSDTFGEVNAMAKHLAQQHVASSSEWSAPSPASTARGSASGRRPSASAPRRSMRCGHPSPRST